MPKQSTLDKVETITLSATVPLKLKRVYDRYCLDTGKRKGWIFTNALTTFMEKEGYIKKKNTTRT